MSLGDGRDLFTMARAMGLSREEEREAYELDVGEAIVKMSGRYMKPFKIRIPGGFFPDALPEEEIKRQCQRSFDFLSRKVVPRSDLLLKLQSKQKDESDVTRTTLESLIRAPFASFVERCKSLKMDRSRLKRILDSLMFRGLICPVTVRTFKKGGQRILYQLTDKAKEMLGRSGIDTSHQVRGDLAHLYYTHLVADHFLSSGFEVKFEARGENGNADLAVAKDGKTIAVEIHLSEKNATNTILKNLDSFDEVIIAFEKEAIRKKVQDVVSKWEESLKSKVTLKLIGDFVNHKGDSFPGKKRETKNGNE